MYLTAMLRRSRAPAKKVREIPAEKDDTVRLAFERARSTGTSEMLVESPAELLRDHSEELQKGIL